MALNLEEPAFAAGAAGDQQRRDLEAFLMCFPSDTHPAIGTQITVDANNKNTPEVISLLNDMTALADGAQVALVAKGVVGGIARGYKYLTGTGNFRSDRHLEYVSASSLRQFATAGGEITFTVVPSGTQSRIGVDRDEDGFFDRDELDAGTDPNDSASFPAGVPNVPAIGQWGVLALALLVAIAGSVLARRQNQERLMCLCPSRLSPSRRKLS